MRLHAPYRNAQDPDFAAFVDAIGDGEGPQVDLQGLRQVNTMQQLIDFVYPPHLLPYPELCVSRNILAPTNALIDEYNDAVLNRVTGDEMHYFAADHIRETEDMETDTLDTASLLDYAARHSFPGIPAYKLSIKTNGVYRLLRNFSIDRGLVKNVRVKIVAIGQRVVTVRLLPSANTAASLCEEDILIPRIVFTCVLPSGHTLTRLQFPLAPAYATTFNSCQGLTLDVIGVELTTDVFSHGQLYTALSRVRHRDAVAIRLKPGSSSTLNVTYPEILL